MEIIYLWLVLCLDGDKCTDAQVFRIDSFKGDAAVTDCQDSQRKQRAAMTAANLKQWRLGCKTLAQFEQEGV